MAGEFGHVSVDENGPRVRAAIEAAGSGTRRIPRRWSTTAATARTRPARGGDDLPDLLRLAATGDARAVEAIEHMARFLGIGLAGLVTGLSPEVIVIVGEVTAAWDRFGPIVAAW